MASSLYNLALDFSKELNYTKAIMARQGDKGITVTVKPFLNGLQMDTSGGTFTLKGTTPSNRYVDSVATSVTSEEVTFSLDGTFMSEAGYYKHCYVEYRKDDQILTTQDIIFFSLGVSDISQGQADEYVSQLEELIQKYNETFDAFMAEIEGRVDSLNQQINDLTGQAKTLQDKLDALKEEIAKLGNLFVMYSNSVDFDDTGEYKYRGIGMRDSKNLEDFVWDLAPKYVEENLATESKVTEIIGEANKYTDNSIEAVNINVTNIADDLAKQINVNENAARNYTDTKKIEAVNESKKYTDEVFRKEIVNLTVKNGNLGTARLYRQGNCVTIYFFNLNGRNSGGNDSVILTVPEGYRTPISFEQLVGSIDRSTLNSAQLSIGEDGAIKWRRNSSYGSDYSFVITYSI
ncbi:hypothetical protein [Enterococcus lactis]|uniref:hypothetical protein n=1 Tax=Enterococcus lactis TaxID=357441 RepID=UPI00237BFB4F|nr:hypothetical protein [Enterococcus lactis]